MIKEGLNKNVNLEVTKTKVACADIVVRILQNNRNYYEIKYFDLSDYKYHVGYSSYNLNNVILWKEQYLEIVDMQSYFAEKISCMQGEKLIDANQFVNKLIDEIGFDNPEIMLCQIIKLIEEQETIFNKDKIIEQMSHVKDGCGLMQACDMVDSCIEIVKAGGIR